MKPETLGLLAAIATFALVLAVASLCSVAERGSSAGGARFEGVTDTTVALARPLERPASLAEFMDFEEEAEAAAEAGESGGEPVASSAELVHGSASVSLSEPVASMLDDPPTPDVVNPDAVTLLGRYFLPEHVELMARIRACESTDTPHAQNRASSAAGWFQVIRSSWEYARRGGLDVPPFAEGRYDAEANTRVAAWLLYHMGGIGHWNASRRCWS